MVLAIITPDVNDDAPITIAIGVWTIESRSLATSIMMFIVNLMTFNYHRKLIVMFLPCVSRNAAAAVKPSTSRIVSNGRYILITKFVLLCAL